MNRPEFLRQLPRLIKNYQASARAIERISQIELLMVVGASGVGKTTLIKNLGLPYVPADTTRPIRPEEQNNIDYFFHSDYDRVAKDIAAGHFVQVAIGPTGDFYATKAAAYPSSGPAVYAVVSDVVPIFRQLGFKRTTSAFITPPSYEEWMRRLGYHKLSQQQLKNRLIEARRSFRFALNDQQMHFILADSIEAAVQQIQGLLGGSVDNRREAAAKAAAASILKQLTGLS